MGKLALKQPNEAAAQRDGGHAGKSPLVDFFASPSAADLVRLQGVGPIGKGGIRGFSDADPKEAEWFARELRRWRRKGRSLAAKH
jgi:hypothetical protein